MSPSELFERLSPSIAFLRTSAGSGSGVIIDGGYILTNAHVVWPFEEIRVTLPGHTDELNAIVIGWDLLRDVAVLQLPSDAAVSPPGVTLASPEDLSIGTELFLIGYPAESEDFPQPTISIANITIPPT